MMNFTIEELEKLTDEDIEEWFDEIPTQEKRTWIMEFIEFAEDARKLQILRAGFRWQVEALETLQKMLNSQNDENPWLGVVAALALKTNELDRISTEHNVLRTAAFRAIERIEYGMSIGKGLKMYRAAENAKSILYAALHPDSKS